MPTFVFADLAGFTALTEAHGDADASELIRRFVQLIRDRLPEGAMLSKVMGDAAMIVVDGDAKAVRLAVELIEAVDDLPGRPGLRIGIHTGDAVEREGDYWGHAVNVAARVVTHAQPCEILVTDAVRKSIERAEGVPAPQLAPRGEQRLRNVAEPVTLFAVVMDARDFHTDPVCRMRLSEAESAERLVHQEKVYYFCSLDCVRAFAANPSAYEHA
jgi:adenylate cyclase